MWDNTGHRWTILCNVEQCCGDVDPYFQNSILCRSPMGRYRVWCRNVTNATAIDFFPNSFLLGPCCPVLLFIYAINFHRFHTWCSAVQHCHTLPNINRTLNWPLFGGFLILSDTNLDPLTQHLACVCLPLCFDIIKYVMLSDRRKYSSLLVGGR